MDAKTHSELSPTATARRGVIGAAAAAVGAAALLATAGPAKANPPDPDTDVISPQEFGAVGDGTADDTAALQAAIDAAEVGPRKLIVVPPGQYRITSSLIVKDVEALGRLTLRGYGGQTSKILVDFDGPGVVWRAFLGFVIDMCFQRNLVNKTPNVVALSFARDPGIVGPNTDDMDATIENCMIMGFQRGIDHVGRGLLVRGTTFAACTTGLTCTWPTAGVAGDGPHVPPYGLRKWFITDNHFHSPFDAIVMNDADGADFRGAVISNNLMDIGRRLLRADITNSTISGNVVENGDGDSIIRITKGGTNLTISNNVLGGFEPPPGGEYTEEWGGIWDMPSAAISFDTGVTARNVAIVGNIFNWTQRSPITFGAPITRVTVASNTFDNWNQLGGSSHGVVRVNGDATQLSFLGNVTSANPSGETAVRVLGSLVRSNLVGNGFDPAAGLLTATAVEDSFVEARPGRFNKLQLAASKNGAISVVSTAINNVTVGADTLGGFLVEGSLPVGAGPGVKGGVQVVPANASGSAVTNLLCATTSNNGMVSMQAAANGLQPPSDNIRDLGSPGKKMRAVFAHRAELHVYAPGDLPAASASPGAVVMVQLESPSRQTLAISDGASWREVPVGATI